MGGRKATMIGTGNLDEDVSGANFDLEMNTLAGKVSCKGDAGQSKTCHLPLGVGSLTFDAMSFPIKKGSTSVSVDLSLSAMLPGALAHTETSHGDCDGWRPALLHGHQECAGSFPR